MKKINVWVRSMLWHIVFYCIIHPYLKYRFHIFSNKKHSIDNVLHFADVFLSLTFPEWKEYKKRNNYSIVGYEALPIDVPIDTDYYVVLKYDCERRRLICDIIDYESNVPQPLAKAIEDYRKTMLTLDYDILFGDHLSKDDYQAYVHSILNKDYERFNKTSEEKIKDRKARVNDILNMFPNSKIYRVPTGYHVYIKLDEPLTFDKIIEIRTMLDDSFDRIEEDDICIQHGLGFLSNFLFNEKCIVSKSSSQAEEEVECQVEEEIDPKKALYIEYEIYEVANIPAMRIETPKGKVIVTRHPNGFNKIVFKGNFGQKEMREIIKQLKEKYSSVEKESVEKQKMKMIR